MGQISQAKWGMIDALAPLYALFAAKRSATSSAPSMILFPMLTSSDNPSSPAIRDTSNPNRRPRRSSLTKSALGAAVVAVMVLTAGQARALVVNVNNQYWDVTTFYGSYVENYRKFSRFGPQGVMPWWEQSTLADSFATAVGSQLNLPEKKWIGPAFGYKTVFSFVNYVPFYAWTLGSIETDVYVVDNVSIVLCDGCTFTKQLWAQATPLAVTVLPEYIPELPEYIPPEIRRIVQESLGPAVPGPLPALGAATGFGFSRKLRKRIKGNKVVRTTFTAI